MKKIFLILIAYSLMLNAQSELIIIMGGATARTTGEILTDSLKAYWNMSDVNDSYGDNDLTNSGVSFVAGKVGNCGNFERDENDFMYILDNATINVYQQDFTIACWFNLESVSQYMGLITKADAANTREFMILSLNQDSTPDAPMLIITNDGSTAVTVSDNAEAVISTWYLLIAWYNKATDSIYIQIDNGDVLQTSFATDIYDGTSAFSLGRLFGNSAGNEFDGLLDEVAVWKRVLTPAERTYLYNSGTGRTYSGGAIH